MDTRASFEAILDKAYASRRAEDVEAVVVGFCEDGQFAANGAPTPAKGRAAQRTAIKELFEAFALLEFHQHCRIIDPPRAAVHWRGTFRAKNGQVGETDVLDLIELRDGRISSLITFFDTAYAANLAAPA